MTLSTALAPVRASAYCFLGRSPGIIDLNSCVPDPAAGINWQWSCAEIGINPNGIPSGITVDEFRNAVAAAAATWNAVRCDGATPSFQFVMYPDVDAPFGFQSGYPNANLIGFRDPWPDDFLHRPFSPSIVSVWFNPSAGHIIDMDMDMNPELGILFSTHGEIDRYDLQSLSLQFMGHGAGLGLSRVAGSVMEGAWDHLGPRRELSPDDIEGFCRLYPPGRSAVCDPEPYNGFAGDACNCRAQKSAPCSVPGVSFFVALCFVRRRRRSRRAAEMIDLA